MSLVACPGEVRKTAETYAPLKNKALCGLIEIFRAFLKCFTDEPVFITVGKEHKDFCS